MKRRQVLIGLAAAAVSSVIDKPARAAEKKAKEDIVDFLFVQNAEKVSLKDNVLTLEGVTPDTLYFSDRPERIVGRVATKVFVDTWADGSDSFKSDPPNAVLSVLQNPEPYDIAVVLKNPKLEGNNLIYSVEVLDGDKVVNGEQCAVFIDIIGRPLTPLSYAGMARRTSRRTARRVSRRQLPPPGHGPGHGPGPGPGPGPGR